MKPPINEESDKSRVWRISIVILLCSAIVIGMTSIVLLIEYETQFNKTSMFLEHRTENLSAESAQKHFLDTYSWGKNTSSRIFDDAVAKYPEGILFHYKSSAEEGYAIVDHGRIVWRRAVVKY